MQRLYHFAITNDRTGETIQFKGQGDKVDDAFKDGVKNCQDTFRHKNDGKMRDPNQCSVDLKTGERVLRLFKDWDSDTPHSDSQNSEPEDEVSFD